MNFKKLIKAVDLSTSNRTRDSYAGDVEQIIDMEWMHSLKLTLGGEDAMSNHVAELYQTPSSADLH